MSDSQIDQLLLQAISAHRAGQVREADRLYTTILRDQPQHPDANHNMGVLAVGIGKVERGLPFFKTALKANPAKAQYWLSYIDAMIKLERLPAAKAMFDQAKSRGAKGDGFDKLERRLQEAGNELIEVNQMAVEPAPKQPNVLDRLKLDQAIALANKKAKEGNTGEAERIYQDVLNRFPKNKKAKVRLKNLKSDSMDKAFIREVNQVIHFMREEKYTDAVSKVKILRSKYNDQELLFNIEGAILHRAGHLEESVIAYKKALKLNPNYAEAIFNLGLVYKDQAEKDQALGCFRKAIEVNPKFAAAHYNKGVVHHELGQIDDAITEYKKAIELNPKYTDALYNIGLAHKEKGEIKTALDCFNTVLTLDPEYVAALNNKGNILQLSGDLDGALLNYQKVIKIQPYYAKAYNNIGTVFQEKGDVQLSLEYYQKAISINSDYADAYNNIGGLLQESGNVNQSIDALQKSVDLDPTNLIAIKQLLHQKQHVCDFSVYAQIESFTQNFTSNHSANLSPFGMLSWKDDPEYQLNNSVSHANANNFRRQQNSFKKTHRRKKIRIGYFGADFHDHATMYLMSGLLREHDKSEFEIHIFSYGQTQNGLTRERVIKMVDYFYDVSNYSNNDLIDFSLAKKIDIAVDLKGYTQKTRTEIFRSRVSPIQINYLGYPGSMGAECFDYIIADPIVIPTGAENYYSEKIIRLPYCYQPNDNLRPVSTTQTSRECNKLPENAFVFCCFNNTYKISPQEYTIWMRLLRKVDGSVLWLLNTNPIAVENLQSEALAKGVNPDRIIFAEKKIHEEHLERQHHADLFLDTFNYNAHTTASDALWGGLPIVTKRGTQFAARVAASLLQAVGLPELITHTECQYENLALSLSKDPHALQRIKNKLISNVRSEPLFNTSMYTKHIETAFRTALSDYQHGIEVRHIDISP